MSEGRDASGRQGAAGGLVTDPSPCPTESTFPEGNTFTPPGVEVHRGCRGRAAQDAAGISVPMAADLIQNPGGAHAVSAWANALTATVAPHGPEGGVPLRVRRRSSGGRNPSTVDSRQI